MADVRIPYTFERGRYRAKVITRYKDESNVTRTVESEPFSFTSNAKEYFTFETNPQIKIDLDTMEPLNAELVDEGQYFGLDYKTYNNGLAIVSGIQSDTMGAADRNNAPWNAQSIEYCYSENPDLCSGYIYGSNNYKEIYLINPTFAEGTTTISYLIRGDNFEYVHLRDVLPYDETGTVINDLSHAFTFKTIDAEGLIDFYADQNLFDDFTSLDYLISFSVSGNCKKYNPNRGNDNEIRISIPDSVISAQNMLEGDIPNCTVYVDSPHVYQNMIKFTSGKIGKLIIDCAEYILDQFAYADPIEITVTCPIPNNLTRFPSFTCPNLEKLTFGQGMVSGFRSITNYSSAFNKCPKIKQIRAIDGYDNSTDMVFDLSNVKYITNMFSGCSDLTELPFIRDSAYDYPYITLNERCSMQEAFKNCSSLNTRLEFTFKKGFPILTSAFEGSGITQLVLNGEIPSSSSSGTVDSMSNVCLNCADLVYASIFMRYKTGSVISMDNAFSNCSKLETFYLYNQYAPSSGQANGFKISHANGIFNGCTRLTSVDFGSTKFSNEESEEGINTFFDENNILSYARIGYNDKDIPFHKNMQRDDGTIVTSATRSTSSIRTYQSVA